MPTKKKAIKTAVTIGPQVRTDLMMRRIEDGVLFPMDYDVGMYVRFSDFAVVRVEIRRCDAN